MNHCKKNDTIHRKNSDNCCITEFPTKDSKINFAISKTSARYPETGCAMNVECDEIVYIQEGKGKIVIDGKECLLNTGDVILVNDKEKFYWDGTMTLHIACTPAFFPEQHIYID